MSLIRRNHHPAIVCGRSNEPGYLQFFRWLWQRLRRAQRQKVNIFSYLLDLITAKEQRKSDTSHNKGGDKGIEQFLPHSEVLRPWVPVDAIRIVFIVFPHGSFAIALHIQQQRFITSTRIWLVAVSHNHNMVIHGKQGVVFSRSGSDHTPS